MSRVSEHGYDGLVEGLTTRDVIHAVLDTGLVEEYANDPKGPCTLLLQKDGSGAPIHGVCGGVSRKGVIGLLFCSPRIAQAPSGGTRH